VLKIHTLLIGISLLMLSTPLSFASANSTDDKGSKQPTVDAAQANNPLANMVAFNIQNYYIRGYLIFLLNHNTLWLLRGRDSLNGRFTLH